VNLSSANCMADSLRSQRDNEHECHRHETEATVLATLREYPLGPCRKISTRFARPTFVGWLSNGRGIARANATVRDLITSGRAIPRFICLRCRTALRLVEQYVGAGQQLLRHLDAELLRCREIDDERSSAQRAGPSAWCLFAPCPHSGRHPWMIKPPARASAGDFRVVFRAIQSTSITTRIGTTSPALASGQPGREKADQSALRLWQLPPPAPRALR